MADWTNSAVGSGFSGTSWLVQLGFLIPDTAWEVAVRYDAYDHDYDGGFNPGASEIAAAVNYYVDGHADKLTLDASFITAETDGNYFADAYTGYNVTYGSDAMLIRFQWQLAL